jgi:hypothetical protein
MATLFVNLVSEMELITVIDQSGKNYTGLPTRCSNEIGLLKKFERGHGGWYDTGQEVWLDLMSIGAIRTMHNAKIVPRPDWREREEENTQRTDELAEIIRKRKAEILSLDFTNSKPPGIE